MNRERLLLCCNTWPHSVCASDWFHSKNSQSDKWPHINSDKLRVAVAPSHLTITKLDGSLLSLHEAAINSLKTTATKALVI